MSTTLATPMAATDAPLSLEAVTQFLYREARFLDDKDWDSWLAVYAPDVEFWMPAWDDDDKLTQDPQREISLIWYGHKGGLEDRVFRIRTERSSATSLPEPRTSHNISNVEILEQASGVIKLRFNWVRTRPTGSDDDSPFGVSTPLSMVTFYSNMRSKTSRFSQVNKEISD